MLRAEARHDKVLLSDQLWRCLCLKPLHGMALSRPEGITEKVATNMVAVDERFPRALLLRLSDPPRLESESPSSRQRKNLK